MDRFGNRDMKLILNKAWPERMVSCIEHYLIEYPDHDCLFLTECDVIFFKPPPEHPGGLYSHLAGYCPKRWKKVNAKRFLHPPWWMDRVTATQFAILGRDLLEKECYENGGADIFIGLLLDVTNVKFTTGGTWSCNSLDLRVPKLMAEAEAAVRNGIWFLHGCHEQWQFDRLMKAAGK